MVGSDTTITKGIPARFDPKAVAILVAIRDLNGEPYTITALAKTTGYPTTEVARYIKEEIYEPRSYEWLENVKKYNGPAYRRYLEHHYLRTNKGKVEVMVNFSKYDILKMVARLMGLDLVKGKNKRGTDIVFVVEASPDYPVEPDTRHFEDSWDDHSYDLNG